MQNSSMPCQSSCQIRSIAFNPALILTIVLLIILAMPISAAAQAAESTNAQSTRPIHIVPMVVNRDGKPFQPLAGAHLTYFGGPVISNVKVVTVFWTSEVDAGVQTTMPEFYSAITDSAYYDLVSEYATNLTGGTNQSIGRGSSGGTFTIAPSTCSDGSACTIDDTVIQTELLAQINGGHLPEPELDGQGNVNTLYMIYFPLNVTITLGGAQSCVNFCGYHGTTSALYKMKNLEYGVLPDMGPRSQCSVGCGDDPNYLNNTTSVSSHELVEAVTDPEVGLASSFGLPLAWYDYSLNGEIGDLCNAQHATVSAGGSTWTVQTQWSNALGNCVAVGEHPVIQLSAPQSATAGTPFSLTITAQNPTSGGTMTSFIGTVQFGSSDSAAVLPASYTFTSDDQGTHMFSGIILNGIGSQNITATDTVNSAMTASAVLDVAIPPVLGFSAFSAALDISPAGFGLQGMATLGAGGAINPPTQPLTLQVGTYTVTVPAGSFKKAPKGTFAFKGTINGVALQIRIAPLGGNSYSIQVDASGVDLTGLTNPVTVTLAIGNNAGTTSVNADF